MPEQKCFTVDGTQVLWKHYRKKQGTEDVIKLCFGKALPEKQWATHHISHAAVNACSTSAALTAAVRSLAAEVLGATIKPPKNTGCRGCQHVAAKPPPLPNSCRQPTAAPNEATVVLEHQSPIADAAAGQSEPQPSESAIAAAATAIDLAVTAAFLASPSSLPPSASPSPPPFL